MKQFFETVPAATKRTFEEKDKIEKGLKKLKNHVGNFNLYQIETTSLENKALSWSIESHVVWQKVGTECIKDINGSTPSNCGQIAKGYLLSKVMNGDFQLTYKGKDESKPGRVCRQKKHLCSSISVPVDQSAKKAKLAMEEKVRSGEIDIGENVIEKVIQKRGADKTSGQLVINTLTVHARKHALHALRVKFFNKYKKFMRLNPDSYFEAISKGVNQKVPIYR